MSPEHSHSVRRIPSLAACLAGAGVLMTLATAFVLILYACPAADDLYRAGIIRTRSWYSEVALNYFIWSGRWSGIGLALVILPRVDIVRWYPILLGALVFFQALGLKTFWRMLLGGTVTRRQVLVLTAVTMAVLWASLPYPGETCYWITGGFENQLNISLSLLLIGGLVLARWEEMSRWRARAWTAGLSLLAFGVTGMHEMIALMLCIVLATGTAIALKTRRSTHQGWAWVAVSLSALIGLAVVVVAPGNSIRSSLYPKHGGMIHALEVAWGLAWQLLPSWVLDVRLLAATLVLVLNPSLARARAGGPRWGGISPKLVVDGRLAPDRRRHVPRPELCSPHPDAGPDPERDLHPVRARLDHRRDCLDPLARRIGRCDGDIPGSQRAAVRPVGGAGGPRLVPASDWQHLQRDRRAEERCPPELEAHDPLARPLDPQGGARGCHPSRTPDPRLRGHQCRELAQDVSLL